MIKKFIVALILFCYTFCPCFCSELYLLQNTRQGQLTSDIENIYSSEGYMLKSKNPYYGKTSTGKFATVILKLAGNDLYCYCGDNYDKTINKKVLNLIKSKNINYSKITDKTTKNQFSQMAVIIASSADSGTDFDEKAEIERLQNEQYSFTNNSGNELKGYIAKIAKGTTFNVYLKDSIDTASASDGQAVQAVLTEDWMFAGNVIAPQGSIVYGTVTKAKDAGYAYKSGRVEINFDKIITPEGKQIDIVVEKTVFAAAAEGVGGDVAGRVIAGALIGAVAGLLLGACNTPNFGRTVAISAGAGAASGLATAAIQKGVDVEIPALTVISLKLAQPLSVTVSY